MGKPEQQEPLFQYATGALKFALNFRHGTVKQCTLAQFMPVGAKIGRGLGGLDGAAQAGMIQVELGRLPEAHQQILVARHADKMTVCVCARPCCRGFLENRQWAVAVDWLTQYVLVQGLTGTISHYRFRRELVKRHFGVSAKFVEMAAACAVGKSTASDQYKNVHEHLKAEERKAHWGIEGLLKAAGVVE